MKKNRKSSFELSLDEEFHMCAAYRYCIGRKTMASCAQAGFIAKKYYDKLSDLTLETTAEDIRREIADTLRFETYNLIYDGSVSYAKRLPLEDLVEFINGLDNPGKELIEISRIEVFCESYAENAPKLYNVSRNDRKRLNIISQYDINCLIPWQRLAALFDKKHYCKVKLNYNGEEKDAICIRTYVEDTEEIKESPGCYKIIPWRYKTVYVDVNALKNGNIEHCGYYDDKYIAQVEQYDATDD